jgi:hypothetical protein
MKNLNKEQSPYTKEWLEKRAFSSLEKIGEGVWDFSDSLYDTGKSFIGALLKT